MKRWIVAVLFTVAGAWAGAAQASTATSDITDMWWNPNESGWGVNVIQQSGTAFVTFFVYDQGGIPIWYSSAITFQGTDTNGSLVWTGPLIATTGPWFGGPFPPANVTRRTAGSVKFTLVDLNDAILQYSVDGVAVTKVIERQTWGSENYTGSYLGGYSVTATNCSPSYLNGVQEVVGALSVTQSGSNVTMTANTGSTSCTFSGAYAQAGKYGQVQGSYACGDGTGGTFTASEMMPSINGFTAYVTGQNQYCQWSGTLGGITRAP